MADPTRPRPSFGNPVAGFIRRPGSEFIKGSFRVTAPFGHVGGAHTTPHQGVDIGNGDHGEPILAMADGEVTLADLVNQAKTIRIKHPAFDGYESGYSHLATMEVGVRAHVNRGDRIGTLGNTGPPGTKFHLHIGMKLDKVEVDSWPLLEQNQETDMLKGTLIKRIRNAKTTTKGDNTRFRPSPGTAEPPLAVYPIGTAFTPDFLVEGGLALASKRWYAGWSITPRGTEFGYMSEEVLNPLLPIEIGFPISDDAPTDGDAFAPDPDLPHFDDI